MGGTNGHNGNGHLNGNGKPKRNGRGRGEGAAKPSEKPLDMTDGRDRQVLRSAVARGWPVTTEDMKFYYEKLRDAVTASEDARELTSCVKVFTTIVSQIQTQEHHEDKNQRLDDGKPTEIVIRHVDRPRIHADLDD